MPLPVYFICGAEDGRGAAEEREGPPLAPAAPLACGNGDAGAAGAARELCANLTYLGRSGKATIAGLEVAPKADPQHPRSKIRIFAPMRKHPTNIIDLSMIRVPTDIW